MLKIGGSGFRPKPSTRVSGRIMPEIERDMSKTNFLACFVLFLRKNIAAPGAPFLRRRPPA
jgi:hypothetical protein